MKHPSLGLHTQLHTQFCKNTQVLQRRTRPVGISSAHPVNTTATKRSNSWDFATVWKIGFTSTVRGRAYQSRGRPETGQDCCRHGNQANEDNEANRANESQPRNQVLLTEKGEKKSETFPVRVFSAVDDF